MNALPRPLDPVRSIKMKLGMVVLSSFAAGLVVFWWGLGWLPVQTSTTAIAVAMITSQFMAHGMTSPMREMTAAARRMACGANSART